MSDNIGMTIKNLRLAKNMTLKDLAEKTDLSAGFLSMVERGLTSAALVSLNKIAYALDVDLSTLFSREEPLQKGGFTRSYENNVRGISGQYVYINLSHHSNDYIIDPMIVVLLPGQKREEVTMLAHAGEEFTYVLEGVLSYFINGEEHVLYPGDCYHGIGTTPHNFVNLTNNIVRVLYIVTPPLSSPSSRVSL